MVDPEDHDSDPALPRSFDRKVRLSTLALSLERLWPRLWLLIGLGLVSPSYSFLGLWPYLDGTSERKIVLAVFALAGLTAILNTRRASVDKRATKPSAALSATLRCRISPPMVAVRTRYHPARRALRPTRSGRRVANAQGAYPCAAARRSTKSASRSLDPWALRALAAAQNTRRPCSSQEASEIVLASDLPLSVSPVSARRRA